jgi:hypothetical protein
MYRTSAQITSAIQILSQWFPNFFAQLQLPENSVQGQSFLSERRLDRKTGIEPHEGVLAPCASL